MFKNHLFKNKHVLQQTKFKHFPKQSRKPWFVSKWLSTKKIIKNFSEQCGFDLLSTRAFNQDPTLKTFSVSCEWNMTNNCPDPFWFILAYRSACVNQLMKRLERARWWNQPVKLEGFPQTGALIREKAVNNNIRSAEFQEKQCLTYDVFEVSEYILQEISKRNHQRGYRCDWRLEGEYVTIDHWGLWPTGHRYLKRTKPAYFKSISWINRGTNENILNRDSQSCAHKYIWK